MKKEPKTCDICKQNSVEYKKINYLLDGNEYEYKVCSKECARTAFIGSEINSIGLCLQTQQ